MSATNKFAVGILFLMIGGLVVIFLSDYYYFGDDLNSPIKMKFNQIDDVVRGFLNKPITFFRNL